MSHAINNKSKTIRWIFIQQMISSQRIFLSPVNVGVLDWTPLLSPRENSLYCYPEENCPPFVLSRSASLKIK